MKCIICKHGQTENQAATVTLERDGATLVFKNVPARVCANCGEIYVEDKTSVRLVHKAEEAIQEGVKVDIREFKAA